MVYATQYMIGNAILGMTNPCGVAAVDDMQFCNQLPGNQLPGDQLLVGCLKAIGGVRFSRPRWRIRET